MSEFLDALPLSPGMLTLAALATLTAALIRGYSGFGLALAGTPLLSLFLAPVTVVPVIMFMQLVSGIGPTIRNVRLVDWRSMAIIAPGTVLGNIPGLMLLQAVPANWVRLLIGITVLIVALQLASGWRLKTMPGRAAMAAVGLISGFLNGLVGIGGPVLIILYMASTHPAGVVRSTLTAAFMIIAASGLVIAGIEGMLTATTSAVWAIVILPLLAGTWLGGVVFHSRLGKWYRPVGIGLLLLIGLSAFLRALYALLAG